MDGNDKQKGGSGHRVSDMQRGEVAPKLTNDLGRYCRLRAHKQNMAPKLTNNKIHKQVCTNRGKSQIIYQFKRPRETKMQEDREDRRYQPPDRELGRIL